ncbi:YwmB family TATA-box binding protein [Paenibacillus sp. KQZ6P-2]|uniref:YwmB family TATA-box binding protein n=1 Tax=Paenibacillus mangrovi TaxID=2931978 RepID=A0A9X1WSM2_9BACL|nr:YwmB family TATA-box binding protein [Paenibacillus mangrovi]MCJ8014334.1 YwmB family TATA-box binding protein [Paenibacillus mangrovi]
MKAAAKWFGVFLILMTVLGYAWAHFWDGMTKAEAKKVSELQTLLELGNQVVDHPQRVVVKWQGAWEGAGEKDAEAAAKKLTQALELPPMDQLTENGHKTYRVIDQSSAVSVRFHWQEISADQSYIIIQLEAESPDDWNMLSNLQEKYGEKMRDAGIDAEWNASLQGSSNDNMNARSTMIHIEDGLKNKLDAVQKETYADATTVSNAYQVPSLTSRVRSGSTWLNMQVAVHEDETNGKSRVTIGLPVITIEY